MRDACLSKIESSQGDDVRREQPKPPFRVAQTWEVFSQEAGLKLLGMGITPQCILTCVFDIIPSPFFPRSVFRTKLKT